MLQLFKKKSFVIWLTGVSGVGKTTTAEALRKHFLKKKYKVEYLNGDVIRSVFNNTSFDRQSINDHIKKIGFFASILEKNGIVVICDFISPFEESRKFVESICKDFYLIYLYSNNVEKRDSKGLYKRYRNEEIKNIAGMDIPYEIPEVDYIKKIKISTDVFSTKQTVNKIIRLID